MTLTHFYFLEEVTEEVQLRVLLWNSIDQWSKAVDAWHEQAFNTLNVDEIISTNEKILENCELLSKRLAPNKIVPKLGADAELMKAQLPAIIHLRNPSLKPMHWQRIETLVKRDGLQCDSITLCVFEEANVFEESLTQQIIQISKQASIEKDLEIMLQSVEDSWRELELSFLPYRASKDAFILTKFDDLQISLNESMIKMNTIAASEFVDHIKGQVDDWIKSLNLFESTLEAWETCQRNFTQLDTIFAAADIQRNLPVEAEMFSAVERDWKKIMAATHKSPHALKCMTNEPTYRALIMNIEAMERVRRRLEFYLEAKRQAFPR